jgi:hypothetical protein
MRSRRELAFRFRQEITNLWGLAVPPTFEGDCKTPLDRLPTPQPAAAMLKDTPFSRDVTRLADQIMRHQFPLLGFEIETGKEIDWRLDYLCRRSSGAVYFRRVPYLDFNEVGDHKIIWELNRHQHLVLLAQAFLFTGRSDFLTEIWNQLESWLEANPFLRGINWASALEIAFRALSWAWAFHLVGEHMPSPLRRRFLNALYQHGWYLEHNLSVYFSRNTHLLGEAVALHALGVLFPCFPHASRWEKIGHKVMETEIRRQVHADGGHFERSAYYHVYALDMFLFHQVLAEITDTYRARLKAMANFLDSILGSSRRLPSFGDDDGGRFFHPYGSNDRFARATLATFAVLFPNAAPPCAAEDFHEQAAWWLGTGARQASGRDHQESRLFPESGIAVMRIEDLRVVARVGPFGAGSAGHSHSDVLSVTVSEAATDLLIDPGTYTYVANAGLRDWFRGSAAHNTIRVDDADQAIAAGPFRWSHVPAVAVLEWQSTDESDYLHASCSYARRRLVHRRRIVLLKREKLLVIHDQVEGEPGRHSIEQFWHTGASTRIVAPGLFRIGSTALLAVPENEQYELSQGGEYGWHSPVFGRKQEAPFVRVFRNAPLPASFWTVLDFSGCRSHVELRAEPDDACTFVGDAGSITIRLEDAGFELVFCPGLTTHSPVEAEPIEFHLPHRGSN